jgi:hypothetical protein
MLARDLEDEGQRVSCGPGYVQLPDQGGRRIVLAHALQPQEPGSERAQQAVHRVPQFVAIDHLLVERALPAAARQALGIVADTRRHAWQLPEFLAEVQEGGLPVYCWEDLERGWAEAVPRARVAANVGTGGDRFLMLLDEPLLEQMKTTVAGNRVIACFQPGAWIVLQSVESGTSLQEVNRKVGLVRHRADTFRATHRAVTLGILQMRTLEERPRLSIGYKSRRPECAPETFDAEGLEPLALLQGVFYNGQFVAVQ